MDKSNIGIIPAPANASNPPTTSPKPSNKSIHSSNDGKENGVSSKGGWLSFGGLSSSSSSSSSSASKKMKGSKKGKSNRRQSLLRGGLSKEGNGFGEYEEEGEVEEVKHASRPWDNDFGNLTGSSISSAGRDVFPDRPMYPDDDAQGVRKGGKGDVWKDAGAQSVTSAFDQSRSSSFLARKGYDGAGESIVGGSDDEDDGRRDEGQSGSGTMQRQKTVYGENIKKARAMSKRFDEDFGSAGKLVRSASRSPDVLKARNAHVSAAIVVSPKDSTDNDWPKAPLMNSDGNLKKVDSADLERETEEVGKHSNQDTDRWSSRISRHSMRIPPAVSLMKTTSFTEYSESGSRQASVETKTTVASDAEGVVPVLDMDADIDLSAVSDVVSHVESASEGDVRSLRPTSNDSSSTYSLTNLPDPVEGEEKASFGTLDSFGSTALDNDVKKLAKTECAGKRDSRVVSELPEFPDIGAFKKFDSEGVNENGKAKTGKLKKGNSALSGNGSSGSDEEDALDMPVRLSRNPSTMCALADLERASARVGDELLRISSGGNGTLENNSLSNNKHRLSRAQGELFLRGRFFRRFNHRYASVVDHAFFGAVLFLFKHDSRGLRSGRTALKNSSMIVLADSTISIVEGRRKDKENVLFQLETAKRKYLFAAPDANKREYWIDHLTSLAGEVRPLEGRSA